MLARTLNYVYPLRLIGNNYVSSIRLQGHGCKYFNSSRTILGAGVHTWTFNDGVFRPSRKDHYMKWDDDKIKTNIPEEPLVDSSALFDAISELERFKIKLSSFPRLFSIGNQSSGKSSVLDSIIGGFGLLPKRMGIATLKPINLTTIRSDKISFKIGDQEFTDEISARAEVERQNANPYVPSIDIKVSSPTARNIYMTDLPGLFSVPDSSDPDLPQRIEELSLDFLKDPNNIPVIVSEAPTDPANNLALRLINTSRRRDAVGILTKTDMSVRQSMDIIKNMLGGKKFPLEGGWVAVVLRNKSEVDAGMTVEAKMEEEKKFFEMMPELTPSGVDTMRKIISRIQLKKIKKSLPQLMSDIDYAIIALEKSKNIFGDLMNDPNKTLPIKLELLIRKLIDSSPDRREFEQQLKQELRTQIESYIGKYYVTPSSNCVSSNNKVDSGILDFLVKHYQKQPDGTYMLTDTSLLNNMYKESFSYGSISPMAINSDMIKKATDDEHTVMLSNLLFEYVCDDPLGKKLYKWDKSLRAYISTLLNENILQTVVSNLTEKMLLDYIRNDPEAQDESVVKFAEYMVKEIGVKITNDGIQSSIRSMVNAEKRPEVDLNEMTRHIIRRNPEYTRIRSGFFGTLHKDKILIDVYGEEWSLAYLKTLSDRIINKSFSNIAVLYLNTMVTNVLGTSIEMINQNRINQEQNRIADKIEKLKEIKGIIAPYVI